MRDNMFLQPVKVAVIDDNIEFGAGIKMLLAKENVEVFTAADGPEGLELAKQLLPDIVLLDVIMPGMDGIEVCKKIRQTPELMDIYIVMLSGVQIQSEQMAEGLEAGADGYIALPIPNRELLARLRTFIRMKRAEKALELTEQKYRRIADNVTDVVWVIDLEMNTTYISPSVERVLGFSPEEFLKIPLTKAYPPASLEKFKIRLTEEFAKEQDPEEDKNRIIQMEVERYYADGTIGWDAINATFVRDEQMNPIAIQGVSRDITERKRAQEALKANEEKLRTTLHSIGDAVISTDIDGRVVAMNPVAESLTGWSEKEAIDQPLETVFRIINEQTRQSVENPVTNVLKRGQIVGLANHTLLIAKDGREIPIADSGAPIRNDDGMITGVVLVFRDQTKEHLARKALLKSEERFRVAQEMSPDGFTILHPVRNEKGEIVDFTWVYENEAIARINGTDPQKIIGKHLLELFPDHRWTSVFETYLHVANTGRPRIMEEVYVGEVISRPTWLRIVVVPMGEDIALLSQDITERKQAAEALRESEARFRTIFEIASLGIVQADPTDGRIILANTYFETITGYRIAELLKMTFNELTHPDDREKDWEIFSKAARGEVEYRNDKRYVKKDGTIVWVRIHIAFIRDETGKPIRTVAICENITEHKEAEKKIALATQHLKHHIENSPLAVIEWDKNFKIKRWTAHAEEFFGWSEAEVINKYPSDWKFVHKDDVQQVNSTMGSLLNGEVKKNISLNRNYAKDGSIVHCVWFNSALVDENGKLLSILSLVHNVTERKHAENELVKLSRAVEQSPVSIIITDIKGNIEYVNAKAMSLSGYELEELKGKNPRIFSLGKQSKEEYKILWETILSGKEWRGELQNTKKNGELYWELASISAIKNKMGHITHFLAVKEDITERKQAERNLQELEIARKTARFKQNFLANMSHEIRTPLTGVLGMIDILELTQLTDDQQDYVNTIKTSGENLKEIINQVLDYSKIEAGKIKINPLDFEFQSILQNTEMLYRNITRQGVIMHIQLDPAIPRFIRTDKMRLSQVVNNLVSNAVKFTHNGSVSVQARLIPTITDEQQVKIEIKVVDTGIGIPAHLQEKLFSPFSQIDDIDTRYYEGTGLGLSICKELVGLLGGEIGVESDNNKGSTFWFTFTAQIAEFQQENEPLYLKNTNHKVLHILLTEDKVVNQKVVSLMLKALGHTVVIANNGAQAIELYERGNYDLILMDIQMPVMNGITATQILKDRFADLPPVIGLSANAFEGDREKYMALGMDEYLAKPVKRDDFQKMIHHFFVDDLEPGRG